MKNENAPLSRHIDIEKDASVCNFDMGWVFDLWFETHAESTQDAEKDGSAAGIRTQESRFCRPLDASIDSTDCAPEITRRAVIAPHFSKDNPNQQTRGSAGIDTKAGHDCGGTVREIPGFRAHGPAIAPLSGGAR